MVDMLGIEMKTGDLVRVVVDGIAHGAEIVDYDGADALLRVAPRWTDVYSAMDQGKPNPADRAVLAKPDELIVLASWWDISAGVP